MKAISQLFLSGALLLSSTATFAAQQDNSIDKVLPDFERYAKQAMHDWHVPGMAIAIVKDGKVVYAKGFGVKKVGGHDPVNPDTLFQIGSVSKTFTAVLTGMLVDDGAFDWHGSVSQYYPEFSLFNPIVTREFMVQDLFSQNSGLPSHVGDNQSVLGYSTEHILKTMRYVKPISSFRSEFAYQNTFFSVADRIMEKVTGHDWHQQLEKRMFKPLGMKRSSATLKGFENASNVSALHQMKDGKIVALPKDYPGKHFVYTFAPAGGVNSTANDMANYIIMLLGQGTYQGKQLISEKTLQYIWSPKTIMRAIGGRWNFYGLGWMYSQYNPSRIVWHNGATLGNKAMLALMPEKNIGIVVLSNLQSVNLPDALALEFLDRYVGNPEQNWSKKFLKLDRTTKEKVASMAKEQKAVIQAKTKLLDVKALPARTYEGHYKNKVYGTVTIKSEHGKLVMLIGPEKIPATFKHLFRDVFKLDWPAMGDDIDSSNDKVYFVVDADGIAKTIYIEFFKDDAGGFFMRDTDIDVSHHEEMLKAETPGVDQKIS